MAAADGGGAWVDGEGGQKKPMAVDGWPWQKPGLLDKADVGIIEHEQEENRCIAASGRQL